MYIVIYVYINNMFYGKRLQEYTLKMVEATNKILNYLIVMITCEFLEIGCMALTTTVPL